VDKTDARSPPTSPSRSKPAGRGAPQIDPKPILDGWKLLEATAIYRASGKKPLLGPRRQEPLHRPDPPALKSQLEQRVLADPRITIYDWAARTSGRTSSTAAARAARVPRRVGAQPYVSTLKCGHSYYVAGGGAVSEHTTATP